MGNTLYLLGGVVGSWNLSEPATDSIQQATFDSAGNLGSFTKSSSNLTSPRVGAQARVIGNYVYLFGGGSKLLYGQLDTIERAPINSDGTLGAFEALTGKLATARQMPGAVVTSKYVYLVGGGYSPIKTIERAEIDSDGSLGTFALVPDQTLTKTRWAFAEARIGDYYYVIAGEGPPNLMDSERALINADGTLGAFSALSQATAITRNGAGAVVLGGQLYLLGNADFATDVEAAPINADGSLGSFATSTTLQVSTKVEHGAVWLGPKAAYVLGGHTNSGGPILGDILEAPIQ